MNCTLLHWRTTECILEKGRPCVLVLYCSLYGCKSDLLFHTEFVVCCVRAKCHGDMSIFSIGGQLNLSIGQSEEKGSEGSFLSPTRLGLLSQTLATEPFKPRGLIMLCYSPWTAPSPLRFFWSVQFSTGIAQGYPRVVPPGTESQHWIWTLHILFVCVFFFFF